MSDDKKKSVWTGYSAEERAAVDALARGYIDFLSDCKTERESVQEAVRAAEAAGYRDLADIIAEGTQLRAGDKVYAVNMKKAIVLFHIGTEPMEHGMNILGAHIDTCRLDVKQNPLYEDGGLAYFDTHYYGGIKKYQWVTIPLALHGVVVKKDGTTVTITLGEKADDPVFCVTDLLVHLSQEQLEKKAAKVIEGEKLDVLIGGIPLAKEEKESVKDGVLALIRKTYGIDEEDFQSAELTLVPAGRARELGFDRSMVLGYGQDDRVCSYTALRSMVETADVRGAASSLTRRRSAASARQGCSRASLKTWSPRCSLPAGSIRSSPCAVRSPVRGCSPRMFRAPMTRSMRMRLRRRTLPILDEEWYSTSSRDHAASPAPVMRVQSIWANCAA